MKKKRSSKKAGAARESGSKQRGKCVNPAELPDTDAPDTPAKRREIPIGRPVSPEQYREIKKEISDKPLPKGRGQEDPSS